MSPKALLGSEVAQKPILSNGGCACRWASNVSVRLDVGDNCRYETALGRAGTGDMP